MVNRKKTHRPYDTVHACILCGKLQTNIQTHLKSHREDTVIKELQELEQKKSKEDMTSENIQDIDKEMKYRQDLLRFQGDHFHNMIEEGEGEIILSRRPKGNAAFLVKNYGPCHSCFMWLALDSHMCKHQSSCLVAQHDETTKVLNSKSLIFGSTALKGKFKPSTILEEVFPSMRRDKDTEIAQKDPIIIALGEEWIKDTETI